LLMGRHDIKCVGPLRRGGDDWTVSVVVVVESWQ
jgi:hypothetical protein